MKSKTYEYIQDPGHGWMKVTSAEVYRLGIRVTHYSYERGDHLYLEEDCDMSAFLQAKDARGEPWKLQQRHVENTRIRNYPSARPRTARIEDHAAATKDFFDSLEPTAF